MTSPGLIPRGIPALQSRLKTILLILLFHHIVQKGISHNLMKVGAKRRRTKEEIRQQHFEEDERLRTVEAKIERYDDMERQLRQS